MAIWRWAHYRDLMTGKNTASAPSRFVRPELPVGSEAVRVALAAVSEAVSLRSAEMYAAYRDAPPRTWIDAMMDTVGACREVAALAAFLGVEVPPAKCGLDLASGKLRAGQGLDASCRRDDPLRPA